MTLTSAMICSGGISLIYEILGWIAAHRITGRVAPSLRHCSSILLGAAEISFLVSLTVTISGTPTKEINSLYVLLGSIKSVVPNY